MPYDIKPLSCDPRKLKGRSGMYEHSYHIDDGAAAAKYVDAFMDNINWTNVVRLHQAHAR